MYNITLHIVRVDFFNLFTTCNYTNRIGDLQNNLHKVEINSKEVKCFLFFIFSQTKWKS